MNNGNRNLTTKQLFQASLVVGYLLTAVLVFYLHSKIVGSILFVIFVCYLFYALSKAPEVEKEKLAEIIKKQNNSLLGRAEKILGIIFIGYLIYALILSFLK